MGEKLRIKRRSFVTFVQIDQLWIAVELDLELKAILRYVFIVSTKMISTHWLAKNVKCNIDEIKFN